MYYPQATLALMQAFGQKTRQQVSRFFPVQTMQVDFILNDPAPTAQVAQDSLRQPVPQVMRFVATFKTILQANVAVQALIQRRLFISQMLHGVRRR